MNTDVMHTLAWSLLHFFWQGAAIAALAAALMHVLRTPAIRYLVGVASIALMFVAFGATFASLDSAEAVNAAAAPPSQVAQAAAPLASMPAPGFAPALTVAPDDTLVWVAQIWLAGVCLLALRVAFGLLFLERLRRRSLSALPEALVQRCLALQRRLGISRMVRFCECGLVAVPAVIGLFRPIVLLPMRALTGLTPAQLEAVIAHELGHIKRFDVAVNFLQVIAETLFFFHPAVWWLNKRIRADREDCCDDLAMTVCGGKVAYARALATMEGWRGVPDLAMAATGGAVAARVARLLGVNHNAGARPAGVFTAALILATALAAGAVSLGMSETASAADEPRDEPVLLAQAAPAPPAPPAPVKPAPAPKPVPAVAPVARPAPAAKPAPAPKPPPAESRGSKATDPGSDDSTSYIAQMSGAGLGDLDVDQLIAMRVHEITPEYVREIRGMGYNPDADEIIAMKVHEITPAYVRQMRALGFEPDAAELIALKVHEVTVEYRDALAAAGYKLDAEELIHAKVMDITPEFIARVRAHGFKDLSMDQLIHLKNAEVL